MRKLLCAALAALMILLLAACGEDLPENTVFERADLIGKTVGVLKNTPSAGYAQRYGGNIDLRLYESIEAMAGDLRSGVLDCVVTDGDGFSAMRDVFSRCRALEEPFAEVSHAIAVSVENRLMLENLNTALTALRNNGAIGRIVTGWLTGSTGETEEETDEGTGGKSVTVAVEPDFYPFAFYDEEGELAGLDLDVARAVCAYLGLRAEFVAVEQGMLSYVAETGKTSFVMGLTGGSGAVAFTQEYTHSTQLIVVRK